MLKMWLRVVLLFCGVIALPSADGFVGINIGTEGSNLPTPSEVVAILNAHQISHVRLFNADARILTALSDTGVEVMVSVANEEVLGIWELPSRAAAWISRNVAAYLPSTNITAIAVGSEVLTSIPHVAPVLVSAMNNLHKALVASNLASAVKISTPHSMDVIPFPFPPSSATFNTSWRSTMFQILQFLRNTESFYMLNAYPYYEYVKGKGIFPLEYALFRELPSARQIVDPNTLLLYNSMFDALVDATYYSIAALNFSSVPVVVTETGWPSFGGASEPYATAGNAETYNNNLLKRAANDTGPPSQPSIPVNAYIYELFNEDHRPGPSSERNWGILFPNGSAVYELSLIGPGVASGNSSSGFCVARPSSDEGSLRKGLNWACGPGRADCAAIQQGHPCFAPDTLQNHASYAYNDYFQKMQSSGGTCDFGGTAMITTVDPSYGSCRFSGASNATSTQLSSPGIGPARSDSRRSNNGEHLLCFNTVIAAVVNTAFLWIAW